MSEKYIHRTYPTAFAIVLIDGVETYLTPEDPRWEAEVGPTHRAMHEHLVNRMKESS